ARLAPADPTGRGRRAIRGLRVRRSSQRLVSLGFGARPRGDLRVPAPQVSMAFRDWHFGPGSEINGDQRGDIRDRIMWPGDEFALRQAGIHLLVKVLHAQASTLSKRRNLFV